MGKRPYLNETLNKLKNERLIEILNLDNTQVVKFVNDNKDYIKAIKSLSETEWKLCNADIRYFIKALKRTKYIKDKHSNIYQRLSECNNPKDVVKILKDETIPPLDTSINVARYILKIVKDEISSPQISMNELSAAIITSIDTCTTSTSGENTSGPSNENNEVETIPPLETNINNINEHTLNVEPNESVENTTNETLNLDKLKLLVTSDQTLFKKLLTSTDSEIHGLLTSKFYNEYGISATLIDEYIKEIIRKYPQPEMCSKKEIGEIFLIKKELAEKINSLENELSDYKDKLFSLENDNEKLKTRLEDALSKLQKYDSASLKKAEDNLFSFNLNDLSCFINNNTTDIQVNIRKALMIKACEYVDALNLLKTKNILTTEQNLPSEIIQIILLELFHEKNLL